MLRVASVLAMASFCRSDVFLSSPELSRRAPAVEESMLVNRTHSEVSVHVTRRLFSRDKVTELLVFDSQRLRFLGTRAMVLSTVSIVFFMFQPGQTFGSNRLPPRWDPSMEGALPFRTWMQDVMLWTICTDMQPPQQCAAIISQLGGQARELARTLSPAEVFGGGIINGVQLDPVSFLMHGLSTRFGPLDEENRLQAAQALLTFARRQGETIDTLISRFEITRARAAAEGGGALSLETSALTLLRACGVSSEQFQALTQPFGLRLPNTEAKFNAMCHHLRRMGHIVERFPNNIASGLRASSSTAHFSEAFMSEPTQQAASEPWGANTEASSSGIWPPQGDQTDWAFAAVSAAGDGASDTDSAASSDHDEPLPVEDLQGLSTGEVDEYLFGQYQAAKKRWRRYSGKPVRALRRVIRRKGKGKGKHRPEVPTTPSQRPVPEDDDDADVFMSPSAFPWWPVPSHHQAAPAAVEAEIAYHSNVRLADGRVGLLVDPGSYGNLVGEQWLEQATVRTSRPAALHGRPQPLQVGGVGHGAQICAQDCKLPIAMRRDDGSIATGSFTSPVVRGSACPALLGLRTLAQNGALLDMSRKQLHFMPQGTEATIVLPPGAETFQLESAQSGHLLLPCGEFGALKGGEVVGEHHLFADNERTPARQHQVSHQPSAESSWHMSQSQKLMFAELDKQYADVLASFTYDAAAAVLKRNHNLLCSHSEAPACERFKSSGISQCFGAYTHGGMTGTTDAAEMFPSLCTMLCRMISATAPGREFSAIMLICDVQSPVHIDRFNQGENILLPVTVPRSGGNLWLELGPGDTLHSEPVLLKADGATRVGQHIALCPGQPIFFSPKRRHATQPWSSGPRLVLAAFSPSTVYKLKESQLSRLVQLGFSPPGFGSPAVALQAEQSSISICNDQQPQVSQPSAESSSASHASAMPVTSRSNDQQPQVSQPSAGSSSASCASAMPVTSRSKQTAADSSKEHGHRLALCPRAQDLQSIAYLKSARLACKLPGV